MDSEDDAGGAAGTRWASALIDAKGLRWLESVEMNDSVPRWDVFKRCVDPSGKASDRDIFAAMFSNETHSAEYIAAFVRAALSVFRQHRMRPH